MRPLRLPLFRGTKSTHKHDDPWRHAVGRGAIQQRRVSHEDAPFWGKLLERRPAAALDHHSAAYTRGNPSERCPAISGTDSAVGDFATRQRAPDFRARRGEETRTWNSPVG